MTSAQPPNAAAGSPPDMTLPKVVRSPATPSMPHQPRSPARKPVMTSSITRSAPLSEHRARSSSLNPGSGGTVPMLPAAASVITQAISSPWLANATRTASMSLYGSTIVSCAVAPVTPGESGRAKVASPEPASARRASTWPW